MAGSEYYHNIVTEAVSWEKPTELMTAAERATDTSDCVWLPTPERGGWEPAAVVARRPNGAISAKPMDGSAPREVRTGARTSQSRRDRTTITRPITRQVSAQQAKGLHPLKMSHLSRAHLAEDLVMLDALDPPLIAHCLQARYKKDEIYTWVGADHTVLVSVNPFQRLPIYGASHLADHAAPAPNRLLPPHTFAIASSAYRNLCRDRSDQSVLISGESGAGKTEATKQCLAFLADVAGSEGGVEQRIMRANPILEAFGNAKTVRHVATCHALPVSRPRRTRACPCPRVAGA